MRSPCEPRGGAVRAASWATLAALVSVLAAGCAGMPLTPPELRFRSAGALLGHTQAVLDVALSPSGELLASASLDDTVRLWDLASGTERRSLPHPDDVYAVAFDPTGALLATGCGDGLVRLYNADGDSPPVELPGNDMAVYAVAFSPDGQLVASGGEDLSVRLWNVATREPVRVATGHGAPVLSVAFSPDGRLLASASSDKSIRLWRTDGGTLVKVLRPSSSIQRTGEMTVSFSADSRRLLSAGGRGQESGEGLVREWSAEDGSLVRVLTGGAHDLWDVQYAAGGSFIIAAGQAGMLYVWSALSGGVVRSIDVRSGSLWSFVLSRDGKTLYVATARRGIQIYRLPE